VSGVLQAFGVQQADVVRTTSATWWRSSSRRSTPQRVRRLVLIDAPVPGVGPWEEILKNPLLWHFRFGGPDMERLVAGRERIYLDRFWNEFSASPDRFGERRASTTRSSTRCRARCIPASRSSRPSTRTRSTTASSWPASAEDAGAGARRPEVVRPMMATVMRAGATT
jgi:pimeloyl-ACP methyl ester carboxylesterase